MRTPLSIVSLFLTVLTGCALDPRAAVNPSAGAKATVLLTRPLPADVGREGRLLTVEYPPGGSTPAHHHDGAIFAYVADGAVITALDDGPEQRFEAGQGWYERPGQVHRVSRNASATQPAKLVVFFLTQPGSPPLRMEK
jgi:quercetin dioxygenase-like cupin family protein